MYKYPELDDAKILTGNPPAAPADITFAKGLFWSVIRLMVPP